MSFDLYGVGGRHAKFTDGEWIKLLELGREYGWEPRGTRAPLGWGGDASTWQGGYDGSNSGQAVTAPDARDLGLALFRGLPDVPGAEVAEKMRPYVLTGGAAPGETPDGASGEAGGGLHPRLRRMLGLALEAMRASGLVCASGSEGPTLVGPDLSLRPVEFLSGERDRVRAFARLALAGGFVIL